MLNYLPIIIPILIIVITGLFIVKQQTSVIIERFGKFQSIRQAGLNIKIPLIDRFA
jgi:regulator of protease activity HflC (stomatin/prohibitin superfamily)